jgi:hypothetical protein
MMAASWVAHMTTDEFRRIALSFRGSIESAHHDHPAFRVRGRIFATIGYPEAGWAVVHLTPAQQARFMAADPQCFQSAGGGQGRRGATRINLFAAGVPVARRCLALAHRNVAAAAQPRPVSRPEAGSAPARASKKRAS